MHDDGGEIQGIKDVTAVSADERFTGDVLTHLDKSMKKLKPPPKIKGREKIKLKFGGRVCEATCGSVELHQARPGISQKCV